MDTKETHEYLPIIGELTMLSPYRRVSFCRGTGVAIAQSIQSVICGGTSVHVILNSEGGDVAVRDQFLDFFNQVKEKDGSIHVYARGNASSAAFDLLMRADTVTVLTGTRLMTHAPQLHYRHGERRLPLEEEQILEAWHRMSYELMLRTHILQKIASREIREKVLEALKFKDENPRGELVFAPEELAAESLIRIVQDSRALWREFCKNTGDEAQAKKHYHGFFV